MHLLLPVGLFGRINCNGISICQLRELLGNIIRSVADWGDSGRCATAVFDHLRHILPDALLVDRRRLSSNPSLLVATPLPDRDARCCRLARLKQASADGRL